MAQFQEYPKCKYHFNGKTVVAQNAEQEAKLGGGWANTPGAWDRYKGPRRAESRHDPLRWVGQWSVEGLSEDHRQNINVRLLRAHSAFWKSPDAPHADTEAMRLAFDGVAGFLFDAGLLNGQLLANEIPELVWDSAIAGGWWRLASDTPQTLFPEKLGHYWVWRDDSRDWDMLFIAEAAEWRARLVESAAQQTSRPSPSATPDPNLPSKAIPEADSAGGPAPPASTEAESERKQAEPEGRARKRMPSTITSRIAARRMEDYLQRNHIGQTEFASRVGITDRTLRTFRQTGQVRRSTLDAIALQMGTSRKALLTP